MRTPMRASKQNRLRILVIRSIIWHQVIHWSLARPWQSTAARIWCQGRTTDGTEKSPRSGGLLHIRKKVIKVISANYKPAIDDKPFVIPPHDKKRKPLSWDEWNQWLKIHNA